MLTNAQINALIAAAQADNIDFTDDDIVYDALVDQSTGQFATALYAHLATQFNVPVDQLDTLASSALEPSVLDDATADIIEQMRNA